MDSVLSSHNETERIYSISENLSFNYVTWDDDVTSLVILELSFVSSTSLLQYSSIPTVLFVVETVKSLISCLKRTDHVEQVV